MALNRSGSTHPTERGGGSRLGDLQGSSGVNQDRGGGSGGLAVNGTLGQGTWLSNQQYKEYLELLKERVAAQQVVSVPVTPAQYPSVNLGGGSGGLAPYTVSQPAYNFLAPRNAGKAAGYGGLPSPRTVVAPRKLP